jgi:geranylgeranyl diphosphate synthase type II
MSTVASLTRHTREIEQHLETLLPQGPLNAPTRYALLGGGKRLRPVLTVTTTELLGGRIEAAFDPACAIEMIHAYSLVHDDLPCMDDDDFRRGRPTLHRAFDEATAVLTGDLLATYPYQVIAEAPQLTSDQRIQLVRLLAVAAGGSGMIGGQRLDTLSEGKSISETALRAIHEAKTGALIACAVEFGGIIAGASNEQLAALRRYGHAIGLAFQIVDDILDVTASEAKHGTAASTDASRGMTTYVSLLGVEGAKSRAEEEIATAHHALSDLSLATSPLADLAQFILDRER